MSDPGNLLESLPAAHDRVRRMTVRWWIWSGVLLLLLILPGVVFGVTLLVAPASRTQLLYRPGQFFSSWFCLLAVPIFFTGLGWVAASFDLLDAIRRRRMSIEMLGADGREGRDW